MWDDGKKRIKARNFFVIAETGEGKSTYVQHILYQFLDQGYKLVVNDLGKSFQNMSRIYSKRTRFVEFEEGQPLGLNPFMITKKEDITNEFILGLQDLVILLTYKTLSVPLEQNTLTSLRKIIVRFYEAAGGNFNISTFQKFLKYLSQEKGMMESVEIDPSYIDVSSFAYALEEFVDDGIYAFLFKEDDKGIYDVGDTDFIVYEMDKAIGDSFLLSVLQMFSYQGTRKLIWDDKETRGILLYEEFAKQLKYPEIASMCEYTSQAIRKQNGAVGYIVQNVNQIPKNDTLESILDNTQIFHILPGAHDSTIERLKLNEHHAYMLKSVKSNFGSNVPYSEVFQLYGRKYANIVRVILPPEHYYAFQTEGDLYNVIQSRYEKGEPIERIVNELANASS